MGLQLLPHRRRARRLRARCTSAPAGPSRRRRGGASGAARPPARVAAPSASIDAVAVGLVDGDHVGQLEHALLDPLQLSPARASISSRKVSTMSATGVSDWPTPTVSTSTTSKPAASTTTIASRVARVTPPSVPGARRRPDERVGRRRRAAPCGSCRRGCCRRCASTTGRRRARRPGGRSPVSSRAERVDERRLADAGHAGDADAVRAAGVRQQARRAAPGPRSWWSGRVDSTSVIARPSAVRSAAQDALGARRRRRRPASVTACWSRRARRAARRRRRRSPCRAGRSPRRRRRAARRSPAAG